MAGRLSFFPVGNGDMTLVQTEGGHKILIDMNILAAADDPDDDTPDVASKLRDMLSQDAEGRLYVDALLVSHPDEDHCRGLREHFHLGPPDEWSKSENKILIREIWSSPMVFRRASRRHVLCDDAKAFNAGCFRHQVLLRCDGHVRDRSSGPPARVSEHPHVAQPPDDAPQGHEDVPKRQPPRGKPRLHRRRPRLASELQRPMRPNEVVVAT